MSFHQAKSEGPLEKIQHCLVSFVRLKFCLYSPAREIPGQRKVVEPSFRPAEPPPDTFVH